MLLRSSLPHVCHRLLRLTLPLLMALLAIGGNALAVHAQDVTTLHNFVGPKNGVQPFAALIRGTDGTLYGTTFRGGSYGGGTLFKVSPDGSHFVTLHAFHYDDGAYPLSAMMQGSDGALYGTTSGGGSRGVGTVFKINSDGTGFTLLHDFLSTDGSDPYAALIQGKDGTLYGTTHDGGTTTDGSKAYGVVFRMSPDGSGFQALHTFTGNGADGANPYAALIQGKDGTLYGTTTQGGVNQIGTVFRLNKDGTGYQTLHSSSYNAGDGAIPAAAVIQGKDGALYGTTLTGTTSNVGTNGGTVFKLNPDGSGYQTLHAFTAQGSDGTNLVASVIQGSDGTLYGITNGGSYNVGTVFKLNPDGAGFQTLYRFPDSSDSRSDPHGPLLQGTDGTLYGTTVSGGANAFGSLFRLKTDGTGYQIFHSFNFVGSEGSPAAALIQSKDGAFYGTTRDGGTNDGGTLFHVAPDGTGFVVLHDFGDIADDGFAPVGSVLQGADGALYGTTSAGGLNNSGTLFKVNSDGTGFQTLFAFSPGGTAGSAPVAAVIQGKDGAFYGTTSAGGLHSGGTVFKINPDGTGFQTLYAFTPNGSDGANPVAAVLQGKDGALYGTTQAGGINNGGTVFRINPDGTGFQTLYAFTGPIPSEPMAPLIQGADGALYGTTLQGGIPVLGTVFRINPDGTGFQLVHNFFLSDGYSLLAPVVQGADGALYGAAQYGGFESGGTLFKVNPDGSGFQILHYIDYRLASEGTYPIAALLQGKDGAFYGTMPYGGQYTAGTVFRLSFASLLSSLAVLPNPAMGGQQNPVGTVTLSYPAPTGGLLVALASSNTGAATVPASVTVPAGKSVATFTVTTKKVPANVTTQITASYNDARKSTVLTVTPQGATLTALTITPNPAVGGQQNPTGTVTLSSPVPSGTTAVVSLSSANTGAATVPASVTIPAGATSATFTITTKKVPSNVTTRITATLNGSTQSTVLTVTH